MNGHALQLTQAMFRGETSALAGRSVIRSRVSLCEAPDVERMPVCELGLAKAAS